MGRGVGICRMARSDVLVARRRWVFFIGWGALGLVEAGASLGLSSKSVFDLVFFLELSSRFLLFLFPRGHTSCKILPDVELLAQKGELYTHCNCWAMVF